MSMTCPCMIQLMKAKLGAGVLLCWGRQATLGPSLSYSNSRKEDSKIFSDTQVL